MPQAAQRARYNLSQYKLSQQKNGPRAFAESIKFKVHASRKIAALLTANSQASESEVGDVAVAHGVTRRLRAGFYRGHQAAEDSGGRSEGAAGGLGHLRPISGTLRRAAPSSYGYLDTTNAKEVAIEATPSPNYIRCQDAVRRARTP